MSIAASENAGLGPCEISDSWASSISNTTPKSSTEAESYCSKSCNNFSANFVPISTLSTTTTIKANTTYTTSTKTTVTADFGLTNTNIICNLPHLSPSAATAAVSNPASTVLDLAPVVPVSTGVVPLYTTTANSGIVLDGGRSAATLSLIARNNNETVKKESSNTNSPLPTAEVLARLSALQQQQAYFFSNNNSLLSINNLLPLHLQYQHQYSSLHKVATTASNIAAALQRSVNMNAVASPISANSTTSNRKVRRKNDSKANLPQSQINKCNNEKRRRELENNYIEQLSEFLQLNKRGDMASTKPDKAAILNQVVKTYRDICDRGQSRDIRSSTPASTGVTAPTSSLSTIAVPGSSANANNNSNNQSTSTRCSRCATDNCLIHPVQQGDVSSTEPPLPEPSLLNGQVPEISAYFEALEHYISSVGWVLLQVNSAGVIESCTQNIRELIGYEKQELYRQPLYMYLYPGDQAKLDPILKKVSTSLITDGNSCPGNDDIHDVNTEWNIGVDSEDPNTNSYKQDRGNSTKVRMLVKETRLATQISGSSSITNNDNLIDTTPKYEEVVFMAASVKDNSNSSSVLCLITRPEDESPLEMNIQQHVQHPAIEQVTFKLDILGKIITLDATTLREPFKLHLSQWSGRLLQDLCHPQDLTTLKTHLRDIQDSTNGISAINVSQSPGSSVGINPPISNVTSKPFRLRLGAPDIYVHVKANSRLFINSTPGESDFIMSVQTLLNTEGDVNTNTINMMSGNSGLLSTGMSTMSPGSSLASSLVSNLSMETFGNTNSVSSPLINVSGMGGLVGGGGIPTNTTQTTNVGGPLMTSAVTNGTGSIGNDSGGVPVIGSNNSVSNSQRTCYTTVAVSAVASNNSALVNSFAASPAGNEGPSFYSNEFDLDLPHSSFEIESSVSAWNDGSPNSGTSVTTPINTQRPPSTGHGFSSAICPSPSTPYQPHSAASLSSPQSNTSQSGAVIPGSISFRLQSFENNTEKNENDNLNKSNSGNNIPSGSNTNTTGNLSNGINQLTFGHIGTKTTNSQQKNEAQQPHNTKPPTESERLRHLLTNKSHSAAIPSLMDGDDVKLYKLEEDKESLQSNIPGSYKMGQNAVSHGGMGTSRMFGMQKSSNSNNPMLLSLLKSEDDEKGGTTSGRSSELTRIKDEQHGSHTNVNSNPNTLSPEDLRRILKHQGDPAMTRKRSLNDPDDGLTTKRSDDRPSKLCETNKMLASLLRNPPKNITMKIQTGIKIIPDKVPATVGRVSTTQSGLNSATVGICNTSVGLASISNKSSTVTAITGSIPSSTASRGRGHQKQTIHTPSDVYLNQHKQGLDSTSGEANLQRPSSLLQKSQGQNEFSSSPSTMKHSFANASLNTTAPLTTATSTSSATTGTSLACVVDGDSELSKILDSVMDYVSDDQPFTPTAPTNLTPQQINERLAISEIQKSLMVETSAFRNCPNVMISNPTAQQMLQQQMQHHQHSQLQPPAYPGSIIAGIGSNSGSMTPQQQQLQMMRMQQMLETMRANQNFQRPPPNYPARGRAAMSTVASSGAGAISATQRYRSLAQQQIVQQQKERLLQQQQKQHMLVPENATARNDHLCLNPNIGTLLNTVAPNVTLSRTNMIPESQLSPNFAQNMLQQQLSPGQRNASFNPQSNSGYGPQYSQSGQRSSPQHQLSQQVSNQQQIAFQSGSATQISTRQPHFSNQVSNNSGNTGVTSSGITQSASSQQWQTQSPINAQQRSHSLQQHNPMLSAQLQGVGPYNSRQYQQQRGRSLNSPSGSTGQVVQVSSQVSGASTMQRQNTFQANDSSGYTSTQNSPALPTSFNGSGNFQQNQRLQRSISVSQAVQHIPVGNPASSDYVKQELRAVVSGRAAATASATGVSIAGGNGPVEANLSSVLRVATPQSPHVPQTSQGTMMGANGANSMAMTPQLQPHATITSSNASNNLVSGSNASTGGVVGNINSGLLNTPPDPAMSFGFDSQDFFGSSTR